MGRFGERMRFDAVCPASSILRISRPPSGKRPITCPRPGDDHRSRPRAHAFGRRGMTRHANGRPRYVFLQHMSCAIRPAYNWSILPAILLWRCAWLTRQDETSPVVIAMTTATHASAVRHSRLADYIVFSALWLLVAVEIWRKLTNELFGSYRPERHYMRGPGPKFREKHAQGQHAAPGAR